MPRAGRAFKRPFPGVSPVYRHGSAKCLVLPRVDMCVCMSRFQTKHSDGKLQCNDWFNGKAVIASPTLKLGKVDPNFAPASPPGQGQAMLPVASHRQLSLDRFRVFLQLEDAAADGPSRFFLASFAIEATDAGLKLTALSCIALPNRPASSTFDPSHCTMQGKLHVPLLTTGTSSKPGTIDALACIHQSKDGALRLDTVPLESKVTRLGVAAFDPSLRTTDAPATLCLANDLGRQLVQLDTTGEKVSLCPTASVPFSDDCTQGFRTLEAQQPAATLPSPAAVATAAETLLEELKEASTVSAALSSLREATWRRPLAMAASSSTGVLARLPTLVGGAALVWKQQRPVTGPIKLTLQLRDPAVVKRLNIVLENCTAKCTVWSATEASQCLHPQRLQQWGVAVLAAAKNVVRGSHLPMFPVKGLQLQLDLTPVDDFVLPCFAIEAEGLPATLLHGECEPAALEQRLAAARLLGDSSLASRLLEVTAAGTVTTASDCALLATVLEHVVDGGRKPLLTALEQCSEAVLDRVLHFTIMVLPRDLARQFKLFLASALIPEDFQVPTTATSATEDAEAQTESPGPTEGKSDEAAAEGLQSLAVLCAKRLLQGLIRLMTQWANQPMETLLEGLRSHSGATLVDLFANLSHTLSVAGDTSLLPAFYEAAQQLFLALAQHTAAARHHPDVAAVVKLHNTLRRCCEAFRDPFFSEEPNDPPRLSLLPMEAAGVGPKLVSATPGTTVTLSTGGFHQGIFVIE